MILFWPAVSVLGFLLVAGLVVSLASSSTTRYESERDRVPDLLRTAAVPDPPHLARTAVAAAGAQVGGAVAEPGPSGDVATLSARHPAGQQLAGAGGSASAWWLVTAEEQHVIAGPFAERVDAEWAALDGSPGHAVHGVLREDGRVTRRQSSPERARLTELGAQLDRLPEEWDRWLTDEDPTATVVVEVAAALVEAGLPLHDCAGDDAAGGVCLTPEPGCAGVIVSWHQHDRMSRDQVRGADTVTAVQRTMNAAVAECLEQLGFLVAPIGASGCSLVTDDRVCW